MTDQMAHSRSDGQVVTRGDGDTDGQRVLTVGTIAALLVSAMESAVGYSLLPAQLRIHWSFGGPHYGPEFAPTWVVLATFPVLVTGVGLGAHWVRTRVLTADTVDSAPRYDIVAVFGTIALLSGMQALLIVANL